ncbi:MAG: peptidylprolyl isomerase [Thaumarchaeota archaeon]|nr:peptidylprolyl isomerase [Nitrososphaerota archaeon]
MVDKPRRRKERKIPWGKIAAVIVVALIVVASGWFVYTTYIYKPPPVYARIDTSLGSFEVELFPACAPSTVANFVSLAHSGFYNNLVWHRIVKGFVIQTGDPNTRNGINSTRATWGTGGSNQTVPLEICSSLHNYRGYLGMARGSNPSSGSSQFYVNLSNGTSNLSLDGNYTVFGKVTSGMGVVDAIANVTTYTSTFGTQPINPVFMKDVVVLSGP